MAFASIGVSRRCLHLGRASGSACRNVGLLMAAIIAIVMSSQESVLNSGAVAFVRDHSRRYVAALRADNATACKDFDCPIRRHCDLCSRNLRQVSLMAFS